MSTAAVSASSLSQQIQQYFQTRSSDLQQLRKALGSGNVAEAQTAFNNITMLGQNGPVPTGSPFFVSQRDQFFDAIGTALKSGDLASAQQAFSSLRSTFQQTGDPPSTTLASSDSSTSGAGLSVSA